MSTAREPAVFNEQDDIRTLVAKLNELARVLFHDVHVGRMRVVQALTVDGDVTIPTDAVNGYALVCDADGKGTWQAVTTTPAGSDTYVQFNDGGAWGASANLTWNDGTQTLMVGQNIMVGAEVDCATLDVSGNADIDGTLSVGDDLTVEATGNLVLKDMTVPANEDAAGLVGTLVADGSYLYYKVSKTVTPYWRRVAWGAAGW